MALLTQEERERREALQGGRMTTSGGQTFQYEPRPPGTGVTPNTLPPDQQIAIRRQLDEQRVNEKRDAGRGTAERVGEGLQTAGTALEAGGAATQAAGRVGQAASKGLQMGGRAAMGAGRGMIGAGAELSATGLGAIAGVPLMAAGGLTAVAGGAAAGAGAVGQPVSRGVEAAGRGTRRAGRSMKSAGKNLSSMSSMPDLTKPQDVFKAAGEQAFTGISRLSRAGANAIDRTAQYNPVSGGFQRAMAQRLGGVGRIADDAKELIPSLTVVGIIVSVFRIHHRLIWGNLLKAQYMYDAEPLQAPGFWTALVLVIDVLLFAAILIAFFFLYLIVNPCAIVPELVPQALRSVAEAGCSNWAIEKIFDLVF